MAPGSDIAVLPGILPDDHASLGNPGFRRG